jgi:hypothetical protein
MFLIAMTPLESVTFGLGGYNGVMPLASLSVTISKSNRCINPMPAVSHMAFGNDQTDD